MAPTSTALTTKASSGSPYQLNAEQVSKASKALLNHMRTTDVEMSNTGDKKNLLDDADDDETASPIWLTLTTKKHIVDKKRLKPSKIALTHPLNTAANTNICLITADPQRKYKDIVASPTFPSELAARITRVVGVKKIRSKHSQYEAQRKLRAEHDIFLADDRIITALPKLLGKTLYKGGSKRPIPIDITAPAPRTEGKRVKRAKDDERKDAASPQAIAKEIEKALSGTVVNLSPSASTSVKIGYSNWDAQKLAENVEAVTNALIDKHVPQKWRGVRALHIKGESTAALPIWLADELWADEHDVLDAEKAKEVAQANVGKKRKAVEGASESTESKEKTKTKKQKLLPESNDDKLDNEIAARKEKLRKQKEDAAKDIVDDVPKASKKSKGKKVAV